MPTRRKFIENLATATGAVVLVPVVTSCKKKEEEPSAGPAQKDPPQKDPPKEPAIKAPEPKMAAVPVTKPEGWDPIAFNKERGNAGAIPKTYHASINGPDGDKKHLGKHLPYVPKLEAKLVPEGMLALMWGDPEKGFAKHPNAPKNESNNNEGHWYNWIKVRKAAEGEFEETNSEYPDWPGKGAGEKGYAVFGGGDMTADGGKNTVYLAGLPKDVKSGDTIRVYAHCLTHGEYVDFLTVA